MNERLRLVLASGLLLLGRGLACGGQAAADKVVIEDFESSREGAFPASWALKKDFWTGSSKAARAISVKAEKGGKYLSVDSRGDSFTAGKNFAYDLSDYRFLSWRWRVLALPVNGSEAKKKTNDSAAAVYVCFKGLTPLSYCLKYVWSSTVPAGTVLPSPHRAATKIVVLRSGPAGLGAWTAEKRNVYEDYLRVFGKKAVKNPVGIAVLTDSDDTRSRAAADYDDFAVSRR